MKNKNAKIMPFPSFDPKQSQSDREKAILNYWESENVFEQTITTRDGRNAECRNEFVFFDGPPFATGLPHYGHILAGSIKDAIPRYKTLQGYAVNRRFGWDCHGVPVEFQVEKEEKIGGKPGIEKMGVGNFNELCRGIVLRCRSQWENTVNRMGRFVDFKNDYRTMDSSFMNSVWWVFKTLWDKNLIYEGEKVIAYSPALGSPLSNFEANLNYQDIDDPAVTIRFKLEDGSYALAWTTTPWTLPSNKALGFGKNMTYALVSHTDGERYWLAESLVAKYFGEEAQIIEKKQGKDFLMTKYTPLFDYYAKSETKEGEKSFVCLHDDGDYISDESGTGIVHFAPSFGADDAELCHKFNVKGVNPIDASGYFGEETPDLSGLYFRNDPKVEGSDDKNANKAVIEKLKAQGDLFKREQIRHSYPHCWRTDCALMYRGIHTWFVDIQKLKSTMIAENEDINWIPEYLQHGRFGKGIETAPDWAISRNRYWGTPMPVWKGEKTGKFIVVGSAAELETLTGAEKGSITDIHRHFIDDLTFEKDGETYKRIPEVLDCWFESGSMPYASKGIGKNSRLDALPFTKAVIIHGYSGNSKESWFPWIKKELESKNIEVIIPDFPDPNDPDPKKWLEVLDNYLLDEKTILIGHSLGAGALCRILEVLKKPVFASYFVAPALGINMNNKYEPFCQKMLGENRNWNMIKVNAGKVVAFYGSDDPLVPKINAEKLEKELGAELFEIKGGGHLNTEYGFTRFDQLLDKIFSDVAMKALFKPADFIAEGLDQTRCWFYNLHALGVALTGKKVFKNVITNGIVLAEDGQKMSKSKKNYPDPNKVFDQYGADAVRWYLLSSPVVRGENMRFAESGVAEVLRKLIIPLQSAYNFFSTYANLDKFKMTSITAVRHGEGTHNLEHRYSGNPENKHHLTELGKDQVAKTAQILPKFDVMAISPFIRTQETAEIIKNHQDFAGEAFIDPRIQEPSFGDLEGTELCGFLAREANPTTEKMPQIWDRVSDFHAEISAKYKGKEIGAIGHGETVRVMSAVAVNFADMLRMNYVDTAGTRHFFGLPQPKTDLDHWLLAELQDTLEAFTTSMDEYKLEKALRAIPPFVDLLTNWYIRRSRRRFWAEGGMTDDKFAAYSTLHHVLLALSQMLSPIMPFFAEELWQKLGGKGSVHISFMPSARKNWKNPELQTKINTERELAGLAATLRAQQNIKLRQPLATLQYALSDDTQIDEKVIQAEANVKKVEKLDSLTGIATRQILPNAKILGKKYGKKVQDLIKAGKAGEFTLLEDGKVEIAGEILEKEEYSERFEAKEGVIAASSRLGVVLLDVNISEELRIEGLSRDLIRLIQEARKENDFAVSDRIHITLQSEGEATKKVLEAHKEAIMKEVLATEITHESQKGEGVELDGEKVNIILKKA